MIKKIKDYRLRLVRVKVFPENILFSGNAIFWKGKCFHVFGCVLENTIENIFSTCCSHFLGYQTII